MNLLNVDEAVQQILAQVPLPSTEAVATGSALGRVLAVNVAATVALPPFDNSAMDGFAVKSADVAGAPTSLQVVMDIPAGAAPQQTLQAGQAARIMTGAPMPDGADAVVPVEQTDAQWDESDPALPYPVQVHKPADEGANVRRAGENITVGEHVLSQNTVLQPQDIGMLAALGHSEVVVYRRPTVVVLSTGDELIGIADPLTPGKIRDTNAYTVSGLVRLSGGSAIMLPPAKDTLDDVRDLFHAALSHKPDVIVSTAGVSVGARDVVRDVLEEMGEIGFWRVNVRPGKPLAFGNVQGVPFFGLPGNPVSAMVTFDLFVRPAVHKLGGRQDTTPVVYAITGEEMASDGRRTYVRVKLSRRGDELIATTTGTQSSGALMSMVKADGLLIIPEGETAVSAGTRLPVRLLRAGSDAVLG